MGATVSLLGLWTANEGLFDLLKIPAALNKQTLIDNLLMECAELEILYPDAEFMREAIGAWSSAEVDKWEELEKTLHYEYDPISNYDRHEEWTDDTDGSSTTTNTASDTTKSNVTNTASGTATNKQAGYNSTDLVVSDGSETGSSNSGEAENSGSSSSTGSSSGKSSSKHAGTVRGNIGVTTTQQMIEEQRRIVNYCVYDVIIDSFQRRFCLLVY